MVNHSIQCLAHDPSSALVLVQGFVSWIELNIQPYNNECQDFLSPLQGHILCWFIHNKHRLFSLSFFFLSNITKVKDIISANLEKKKHRIRTGGKYLIPHYQIDINENNERTHLITIDTNFFFFLITSIQVKV